MLIALISSLVVVSGCGKKEEKVIKIGVIGPMTGEGATYGAAMKRGVEIAVNEINMSGGINKKKIELIYEDSKLNAKDAINGFRKLVDINKVPVVIGAAASKVTLNIAPLAEKSEVVLISSISTADKIKYAGDFIFRDVPPNRQQGKTAANFVIETLGKKNCVVFYKNDDYGISLADAFIEAIKNKGGKILLKESYSPTEPNYKNQLSKIKQLHSEVIFFPGNYEDTGKILKQARELGLKSIFIGGDGSYSPELLRIAGKAAEGSYYTVMGLPTNVSEEMSEFRKNFKDKYNTDPDVYSIYSYDAAMVVLLACKNIKKIDGESIKNELYKSDYMGLTGTIKFDQYGEVDKDYAIYTVKNGIFTLFK